MPRREEPFYKEKNKSREIWYGSRRPVVGKREEG